MGRLLAQLGITAQKPLWKAYQQDPERVRKWVQEEYPAIEKEARQMKAEIWVVSTLLCKFPVGSVRVER